VRRRRYDEAAEHFGRCAQANPRFSPAYANRAYSLVLVGRREEARQAAARVLEIEPNFSLGRLFGMYARFMSPEFDLPAMMPAAREAGLPE
jgi:tetratricopeptide (TPR) repeat protein